MSKRTPAQRLQDLTDAYADFTMACAIKNMCEHSAFRTRSGKRLEHRLWTLADAEVVKQFKRVEQLRALFGSHDA